MHSDQPLHDGEVALLGSQVETGIIGGVLGVGGVCIVADDVTDNPAHVAKGSEILKQANKLPVKDIVD